MTFKELYDKMISMTGSQEFANEILGEVQTGVSEDYLLKRVFKEYCRLCLRTIIDDPDATYSELGKGMYLITGHDGKYVCVISDSGAIDFYEASTSYSCLQSYMEEWQ